MVPRPVNPAAERFGVHVWGDRGSWRPLGPPMVYFLIACAPAFPLRPGSSASPSRNHGPHELGHREAEAEYRRDGDSPLGLQEGEQWLKLHRTAFRIPPVRLFVSVNQPLIIGQVPCGFRLVIARGTSSIDTGRPALRHD